MALSQKYSGKVLVPWYNNSEWQQVCNYLREDNFENLVKVLHILKIWKRRTPLLSAGVEGTLIVLDALSHENQCPEEQIIQTYAISILRFFNLCAANSDRQGTFQRTAQKNALPRWLIDIRHDIAHGHKLPSKCVLEVALKQSLQWLKEKYWDVQDKIWDYIITDESQNNDIADLLTIYIYFNISSYYKDDTEKCNHVHLEKVNEIIAKNYRIRNIYNNGGMFLAVEELVRESFAKSRSKYFSNVTEIIISQNSLLKFIPIYSIQDNTYKIPKSFKNIWTKLLNITDNNRLLYELLSKLFEVTYNDLFSDSIRVKASLWIHEIFQGLNKTKAVQNLKTNPKYNETTDISQTITHIEKKHPEFRNSLNFEETNLLEKSQAESFEEKVLNSPNTYTLNYIESILKYNKNSPIFIEDIKDLVSNFIVANDERWTQSKIFTVSDIPFNNFLNENLKDGNISENKINNYCTSNRWVEIKDKTDFVGCPLGVLPQQGREKNPLIEF